MAILSPDYLASLLSPPLHSCALKFLQWAMLVSVHAAPSPRTWVPTLSHGLANLYPSHIFFRAQLGRHCLPVMFSCLSRLSDGEPKHTPSTAPYTCPVIAPATLDQNYGFYWGSLSLQASQVTFITAWPFQQRKSLRAHKLPSLFTHQVLLGSQHQHHFFYICSTIPQGITWGQLPETAGHWADALKLHILQIIFVVLGSLLALL